MSQALTFPDEWLTDIENAIAHPERFKFVGIVNEDWRDERKSIKGTVIPPFLREQYELFHNRAVSHSITKGEHEAAALMNFYVILKYHLWRADYESRLDYLQDVTSQPFAVSQSTIEHFVADADKLIAQNMPIRQIVAAFGKSKGAASRIAQLPETTAPDQERQQLLETVTNLAPHEAHRYLDDIEMKDVVKGVSGVHDSKTDILTLEVQVTHPMPVGTRNINDRFRDYFTYHIPDVNVVVAYWSMEKLRIPESKRAML